MGILFVSTCCVSKKGRLKKDVLAWYVSLGLMGNHSYRHHKPRTGPLRPPSRPREDTNEWCGLWVKLTSTTSVLIQPITPKYRSVLFSSMYATEIYKFIWLMGSINETNLIKCDPFCLHWSCTPSTGNVVYRHIWPIFIFLVDGVVFVLGSCPLSECERWWAHNSP